MRRSFENSVDAIGYGYYAVLALILSKRKKDCVSKYIGCCVKIHIEIYNMYSCVYLSTFSVFVSSPLPPKNPRVDRRDPLRREPLRLLRVKGFETTLRTPFSTPRSTLRVILPMGVEIFETVLPTLLVRLPIGLATDFL